NFSVKKKVTQILKFLLLALFLSYYCESTLFVHTHVFDWGTVTHSHPYLPNSGHTHTAGQCQSISFLSNIFFTLIDSIAFVVAVRILVRQHIPCRCFSTRLVADNCSLRAPPASIC
ncbi:MAG: hypothetical protein RSA53_07465, partial [Odoribacter sp.]